jgi:hypothetical protein
VSATTLLNIDASDFAAYCYVTLASNGGDDGLVGGSSAVGNYQQASVVDAWFATAGDSFQMVCYSNAGDSNTLAYGSSLTATLINSSFAPKKSKHVLHAHSGDPKAPQ